MSLWRRLFGTSPEQSLAIDDPWEALVRSQYEEIAYLRAELAKAQERIVQMSDPLLEARVAVARQGPPVSAGDKTGNTGTPHNPRLLALKMEAREPRPVGE